MGRFEEFNDNYSNTVKDGIDTREIQEREGFTHISDYTGGAIVVDGFFFNNAGKYGEQVVVVGRKAKRINGGYKASGAEHLINVPKRYTDKFHKFAASPELMDAIFHEGLAIDGIKAVKAKNGPTTIFDFRDNSDFE